MAWTTDLVLFVRTLIGDLDSSKYTDARLEQIISVAAYKVNDEADFNYTYTVDIATKEISPDPIDNKDTDFTVLTAYQASCIILGSEVKTEAANSLSLRDGPSAIDLRGVATTLNTLYNDLCKNTKSLCRYTKPPIAFTVRRSLVLTVRVALLLIDSSNTDVVAQGLCSIN